MHKLFILSLILLGMTSCKKQTYQPQDCDLIFQVAKGNDFSKAITDATAQTDEIKIDHVGMIVMEKGVPHVLEASSKRGVSVVSLQAFIDELPSGYIIKRVKSSSAIEFEKVIQSAKSHIGEPYDWSYLPDNGKMYCSELIYECYRDNNGLPIFQARPMNFLDKDGNMPQFWTDLFKRLQEKIPQGVIGTNPNDLSKEEVLEEVYRLIPTTKQKAER